MRFILTQLQQAIKGEVVMTEELQETLYAVYDAKVGEPVNVRLVILTSLAIFGPTSLAIWGRMEHGLP